MNAPNPIAPAALIARLGDDLNWWIDEIEGEPDASLPPHGVLDPRQVAFLVETLEDLAEYGLSPASLSGAFQPYTITAELSDGRLRLVKSALSLRDTGEQLFALPLLRDDETTGYHHFLEILSAARIRLLNATHTYTHPCTEDEMYEELDALDTDRYFSADQMHAFDELNEILTWSPAEWDDNSA